MEKTATLIRYPENYSPGKQDRIKNYATVKQLYAHPVSPTIITLMRNLETNNVFFLFIVALYL